MTEYVICAETAITLRNAGETLSDGLLLAVVLKGLPESFNPFAVHVTQCDETISVADIKAKLRSYEDTEKMWVAATGCNAMKACMQQGSSGTAVFQMQPEGTPGQSLPTEAVVQSLQETHTPGHNLQKETA